jgi:flagellar protein FlbD
MIQLTRLSHLPFVLNCDLIESIETTPDTVISLTTGQKLLVRETPPEIIELIKNYKRSIMGMSCIPAKVIESGASRNLQPEATAGITEGEVNGRL